MNKLIIIAFSVFISIQGGWLFAMENQNILQKHVFRFEPLTAGDYDVYVVGDFNGWKKSDNSKMQNNKGIYSREYELEPGEYAYKFIVNGKWIKDENASKFAPDNFGGENSLLIIKKKDIQLRKVHIEYPYSDDISEISVVGSFNKWNPSNYKMMRKNDSFSVDIMLPEGNHEFKFLLNNKDYACLENKYSTVPDGLGGKNNSLIINDSFPLIQAVTGDSSIEESVLVRVNQNIVEKINHSLIKFTFRTVKNDVETVTLILNNNEHKMIRSYTVDNFDVYQTILNGEDNLKFNIKLLDGENTVYYCQNGFSNSPGKLISIDIDHLKDPAPDWVNNGIIYQIFPDRFHNGNQELNQNFKEWYYKGMTTPPLPKTKLKPKQKYFRFIKNWYDHSLLQHNPLSEDGSPDLNTFYGGDIEGIHQKLDYLEDLGINVIYLNPIYEARSNHKYDVIDFMKIDPHFGDKATFKKFVSDAHKRGIKVMLDIVLNHSGDGFHAFQHVLKYGKDSNYYNWYEFRKLPVPYPFPQGFNPEEYYASWWEHADLPDFNYDLAHPIPQENDIENIDDAVPNQELVDYMLSVAEFWLGEMNADGFRLDVPNEVPFWFLGLFRDKCRDVKSDAVIIGEIWQNADKWMRKDYFNGIMNYEFFKDPVIEFICNNKINAEEFDQKITHGIDKYTADQSACMMNVMDSHDTYRILQVANGVYGKVKLAALFQMTFIGLPHIWYGDEIAMTGGKDPDNRRPFNWKYYRDKESVAFRKYYKKLISIRKENEEFTVGGFKSILAESNIYVYSRFLKKNEFFILLNTGNSEQVISFNVDNESAKYIDLLSEQEFIPNNGILKLTVNPLTGMILKAAD